MQNANKAAIGFAASVGLYLSISSVGAFFNLDMMGQSALNALLVQVIAIYLPACFIMKGRDVREFGVRRTGATEIMLAIAMAVGCFFLVTGANGVITTLLEYAGADFSLLEAASQMPVLSGWQSIVWIFLFCLVPAFTEEYMFRGALLHSWGGMGRIKAVLLTSLLFSLMHGNLSALPAYMIIACVLGGMTVRSKSVIPSMVTHFCYNLLVLGYWTAVQGMEQTEAASTGAVWAELLAFVGIGALLTGTFFAAFAVVCRNKYGAPAKKSFLSYKPIQTADGSIGANAAFFKGRPGECPGYNKATVGVCIGIAAGLLFLVGLLSFVILFIDFPFMGI